MGHRGPRSIDGLRVRLMVEDGAPLPDAIPERPGARAASREVSETVACALPRWEQRPPFAPTRAWRWGAVNDRWYTPCMDRALMDEAESSLRLEASTSGLADRVPLLSARSLVSKGQRNFLLLLAVLVIVGLV